MGDENGKDKREMKEQIEIILKDRKSEEITELLLDNYKSETKKVVGLEGRNFEKLNHLSMIACDLESLEGLPVLDAVRIMDLSENALSDVAQLAKCVKNLYHLNLCGNKLENADALKPLSEIENLQAVDLYDCPLTEKEGYREQIFQVLPSLKYLDGFDINNEEADHLDMSGDEDEDGDMSGIEVEDSDGQSPSELEDEVGLDYLNSSKVNQEDSSADFVVKEKSASNGKPATKRKADEKGDGEAEAKKAAN